nr:MAG TPA: hypothetical protein [Caudoviricetes sp.]DAL69266.1 MAG TPA: hypothetical protein [Caudoviricetes sp.]
MFLLNYSRSFLAFLWPSFLKVTNSVFYFVG